MIYVGARRVTALGGALIFDRFTNSWVETMQANKMKNAPDGAGVSNQGGVRRLTVNSLKACLMATVLASGFSVAAPETASAQGLFQRLFNPENHRRQQERQRQEELRKKAVSVKVAAPRYLNYTPDTLKKVSLAPLSEKKTAELQPASEGAETADAANVETDIAPVEPAVLTAFDEARPALKGLSVTVLPEVGEALIAYYREHPDFVWVDENGVTLKAAKARREMASAAEYALVPEDYFVPLPALSGLGETDRDAALMRFEMQMSAAALSYVLDATRGRVDPNKISQYHDLPRHDVDLVAALEGLSAAEDMQSELVSHQPQNDHFRALASELKRLKAEDEEADQIVIAPGTFLKAGKSSPEMKNIVAGNREKRLGRTEGSPWRHAEPI